MWNLLVGDGGLGLNVLGQPAKPGAEDDANARGAATRDCTALAASWIMSKRGVMVWLAWIFGFWSSFVRQYTVPGRKTNCAWVGRAMTLTIEATYEGGVLRPLQPLPLREHQTVVITIQEGSKAEEAAGLLRWTGDPEDLRRIAEDDEFGVLEAP